MTYDTEYVVYFLCLCIQPVSCAHVFLWNTEFKLSDPARKGNRVTVCSGFEALPFALEICHGVASTDHNLWYYGRWKIEARYRVGS